jgi:hypothetical protein
MYLSLNPPPLPSLISSCTTKAAGLAVLHLLQLDLQHQLTLPQPNNGDNDNYGDDDNDNNKNDDNKNDDNDGDNNDNNVSSIYISVSVKISPLLLPKKHTANNA